MSTEWNVVFYETLAEYLNPYKNARGDSAARARIIENCAEEISNSSVVDEENIDLPADLSQVSFSFH
jgi:hypothetical protein